MEVITYVIPDKPVPLQRPRFGNGRVYDPQQEDKDWTWAIIRQQRQGPIGMLTGPIHLDITFFMHKPKRAGNRKWHTTKPDLSNLIKFYEDVCTGILYYDDKQIVKITANKVYDDKPRTELSVTPVKE